MQMSIGKTVGALAAIGAIGLGTSGIAAASHSSATPAASASSPSRLDDGKDLLPQAGISESQAIAAAQKAASGDLNEVDLEQAGGKLVFTVDVGVKDVQVDAQSGTVVSVQSDD